MNLTQKHKSEDGIECSIDSGILSFTVAGPHMVEVEDQLIQTNITKMEDQSLPTRSMVEQQGVHASLCLIDIMTKLNRPFVGSKELCCPLDFHWVF